MACGAHEAVRSETLPWQPQPSLGAKSLVPGPHGREATLGMGQRFSGPGAANTEETVESGEVWPTAHVLEPSWEDRLAGSRKPPGRHLRGMWGKNLNFPVGQVWLGILQLSPRAKSHNFDELFFLHL